MKPAWTNKEFWGWIIALILPFFIDPHADGHMSLCLFHQLGFDWCPGCGLGRSMALLYLGEWQASFRMHFMGAPALLLIAARIVTLFRQSIKPSVI